MNTINDNWSSFPTDFEGWWNVRGEWVDELNQRRNGWSGMMRLRIGAQLYYIKKQCNYIFRSMRHPFGWPTASREYQNILTLKALGLNVPVPIFYGARRNENGIEAVLVTEELRGFSALSDQTELEPTARETLAKEVGRILGILHKACLQHSCMYDKHIMVRWQDLMPEIALIDLEKLRRPVLPWRAARHDLDQLKRRQFIWTKSEWDLLEQSHQHKMLKA